jgi:hypothetical protein
LWFHGCVWYVRSGIFESPDDRDYWIDAATLEMLEESGADAEILHTLGGALGTREGVNVRWR